MKKSGNILFLAGWLPNQIKPQSGDFILHQADLLRKQGLNIDIIGCDLQFRHILKRQFGFKKESRTYKGIAHEVFMGPGYPERFRFSYVHWYRNLRKLFIDYKINNELPALIHAHTSKAIYSAYKLKREFSIPYIATIHSSNYLEDSFPKWHTQFMQAAFHEAEHVITISRAMKDCVEKKYGLKNCIRIPNFINSELFHLGMLKNERFSFISSGNMVPIKRYELLIQAFELVHAKNDNCQLILLGEGTELQRLKALVNEKGLNDSVVFTGIVAREEVSRRLAQAHVYVQTSKVETFSLSILEALFTGLPVITTDSMGPRDLINDLNGKITASNSPDAIAKEMLTLMHEYNSYDQKMISQQAQGRYSSQQVAQQYVELYNQYLG